VDGGVVIVGKVGTVVVVGGYVIGCRVVVVTVADGVAVVIGHAENKTLMVSSVCLYPY